MQSEMFGQPELYNFLYGVDSSTVEVFGIVGHIVPLRGEGDGNEMNYVFVTCVMCIIQ